jgi:hypothetical protein
MTFNVWKFMNSEVIDSFSNAEIGQWMRLFCKALAIGKECTLPVDVETLAKYAHTKPSQLSQAVLDQFPVTSTEFGERRRNRVQHEQWCEIGLKSDKSRESAERLHEQRKRLKSLESPRDLSGRTANAEQSQDGRGANRTEQNKTEQNNTEQRTSASMSPSMDFLDETSEEQRLADEKANAVAGRKPGDPGYFRRGQYPGTSTKDVWKHCVREWSKVKGESAYCRFPTKHPSADTDPWKDLCEAKAGDLIVPAFQLWIQEEGKFIDTQWPLSQFLKTDTLAKYMKQVRPLNDIVPKITEDTIKRSNEIAAEQHRQQWGITETPETVTTTSDDFDELLGGSK